jgi:hypothetical protein
LIQPGWDEAYTTELGIGRTFQTSSYVATLPPRAEDATDWQWQETSPSKRPTVKFCDLFVEDQRVDSPGVPSSAGQRFLDFPKEIRVRKLS